MAKKIPRQSDWITVPASCMPSSFKVTTHSSDVAHVHVDPGRVGRVVMQRIANPCTPVRFRYPPPQYIVRSPQKASPKTRCCFQFLVHNSYTKIYPRALSLFYFIYESYLLFEAKILIFHGSL